ncbi:MAG: tRNA (adenosine(37)-N6)-threonylcarbamoyltransferase complex ATPase subunit type 1 TsaE [Planctomycetales bacterium]|nr:tRNA (adenosine(37)-N6)-threonylcarbamoyltransferase complex ATPase subunit type 1 TsaE [Planctomycetales bacterium]
MKEKNVEIVTHSAAETVELGRKIGSVLRGGEVIALIGDLGTGKTHLIKGIALGLEARDAQQVTSPTFVLVSEYLGRGGTICIYHIDAYRIETLAEFQALGFDEYCRPDSVVLVEWADKIMPVLQGVETIELRLEHISKNRRKITIQNVRLS